MTAEEVSGIVVKADSGAPIASAIVAIRFWRTLLSLFSVQADQDGRFKFAPWKQADTRAHYAIGEVKAYKAEFAVPRGVDLNQRNRSIGPIALCDTITLPKTVVRVCIGHTEHGSDENK